MTKINFSLIKFLQLVLTFLFIQCDLFSQCPPSEDCEPFLFQSYAVGDSCDHNCFWIYNGENGNLRVPVKTFFLGQNINVGISDIETFFTNVSFFFQNEGFKIELFNVGEEVITHSDYNNWCYPGSNACSCPDNGDDISSIIDTMIMNLDVFNLYIVDTIIRMDTINGACQNNRTLTAGFSIFPNESADTAKMIILKQKIIEENFYAVFAHEFGHQFGLFHTFQEGVFTQANGCQDSCKVQDGIGDTPYDNSQSPSSLNLMDYNEEFTDPSLCPYAELSDCQVAKMYQILFGCRNTLCSSPLQPDVQMPNNLSVNQLNYIRGNQMDTLLFFLDSDTGTNSGNYTLVKLKDENGQVLQSWFTDSLDLNTVFSNNNIPDYGAFIMEVIDSSIYNPNCFSVPTVLNIVIDPCNSDGICEYIEECTECEDCTINLENGLIAHYPFNGNANDESGNGHHGTLNGPVLTTDRFGNMNSAFYFDGQNDFISILTSLSDFENQHFTISAWVKWEDGAWCCGGGGIFDITSSDEEIDHYALTCHNSNIRSYINYPDPNNKIQHDTTALTDNNWHHVVATYNGAVRALYLDGILLKSEQYNEPILFSAGTKAFIGVNLPGGDDYFKGKIDETRIYNRALSCNEINELYHYFIVDLNKGLIAHYPFNGNANDESGNEYHGDAEGASLTTNRLGTANSAYEFDGVNDYIELWNFDLPQSFSVAFWMNSYEGLSNKPAFVNKWKDWRIVGEDGTPDEPWMGNESGLEFSMATSGNIRKGTGYNNITINNWYFVVACYDDETGDAFMYIDGEEIGSFNMPSRNFNTDSVLVGVKENYNVGFFEGKIDDVRIYNRLLHSIEIDSLYKQNCPPINLLMNQTFSVDTTIYATNLIELDNVTVDQPFELTLKSPEVLINNYSEIQQGAKLIIINENVCNQN